MIQVKQNDTVLFIFFSLIFFAVLQCFQDHLIYRHDLFFSQPWRWWTAHWVHVGWIHYVLNVLALMCLPFLFPQINKKALLGLLIVLPPFLSLSFYYFYPEIYAYAGLSGILHGLFVFSALMSLKEKSERHFALIILLGIILKLVWEHFFGALQTQQLIGHPVLTQAHLLGVIYGSLAAALCLFFQINIFNTKLQTSKESHFD